MKAQRANARLLVSGMPLAPVTWVTETRGPTAMERLDGQRSALVQARVDASLRTPTAVNAA